MVEKFLKGKVVGISISSSSDIENYGFSELHLQDSLVELARYLLACGANLAYGGDIKYDGKFNYAGILFDLIENFSQEYKDDDVRVKNYICYPIYKNISPAEKAKFIKRVIFKDIIPTKIDITKDDWYDTLKNETTENLYKWSVCLTEMRELMNLELDARIVMGGKVSGFKGKYPGIVEETILSLHAGKPVFLIGAFGGATLSLIKAFEGQNPDELQTAFQTQNPLYKALISMYNGKHPSDIIDYPALIAYLNKFGIAGLCALNGLSEDENRILFTSKNIFEIIMYILKGLKSKLSKPLI